MLAAGSFGIDIDSVNLTPRVVAIISRWIFPIHPGVVPLCASDATRDCQKGLQRLGSTRFAGALTTRRCDAASGDGRQESRRQHKP
ncbi:hypothetical protein PC129_g14137 [Phytophthora cactorum]|uniref:Uncharacterized protein n=1 Tax=Phytophthora cactorum TaxID=29920 RepID=A0A8T1HVA7_9STRA|nr:hypothetical protein Pcac1_g6711 [Phytophthora cactorum]KAG2818745.1 hypothetical protein PC112_g12481 [Phytophthora cactorum]KAG2918944.1 hypothetical protein PC117_g16905 [Phytophthora cactorum]KAG3000857.1 hypothetical protein PC120_g20633 [Phytophthora cactorum]KAG3069013.1 hypothetical protein PC121_g9991 [Phytophthora cactorum]